MTEEALGIEAQLWAECRTVEDVHHPLLCVHAPDREFNGLAVAFRLNLDFFELQIHHTKIMLHQYTTTIQQEKLKLYTVSMGGLRSIPRFANMLSVLEGELVRMFQNFVHHRYERVHLFRVQVSALHEFRKLEVETCFEREPRVA